MLRKQNNKKIVIGYDLANACSQISFCRLRSEDDVETVGAVEGEENYDIPTVLCKRAGTNQWLFGNDALRFCREKPEEGILVNDLLQLALSSENVRIEEKEYHPATLLALFIRRSLGMVVPIQEQDRIAAIMFTSETADENMERLISRVIRTLELKSARIMCQSYEDSFFAYLMRQPENLWEKASLLLDYRSDRLISLQLECNHQTVPKVMYSEKRSHAFAGTDRELLAIAEELCGGRLISSVYLIGEKFGGDWMEESLRYLCTGRRVFQGNNLYSKGACYSLLGDFEKRETKEYIFLGPNKLKANVGMRVQKRGEDAYSALLDAGMYWREAEETVEFYIRSENNLEFMITPLVNSSVKYIFMELDGLDLKPGEVTRIRLKLSMPEGNRLSLSVTDLGFGDFRQASDGRWQKEVELY